jgi:hypothetical protein
MTTSGVGVVAEGKKPKGGPKILAHLEIHPAIGGGHTVRHVYSGYQHESRQYSFKDGEDDRLSEHLHRHLGIKPVKAEGSMHENEEDIETERQDYGTKGKKGTASSYFKGSRAIATPSR